ncbi:hypothetical protein OH779_36220 [Actinacidiphila glaucinigra]|uniref:hypothetical protein n=1 Tax=Actinacidiphila glaucinigra TaxID=235986 RepID=UPI003869A365
MNASATAALTPLPDGVWSTLSAAREAYRAAVPAAYDEVLTEIAERARDTGSLGKTDVAALVVWKRLQAGTAWVVELMNLRDAEVRAVTSAAVDAVRDPQAPRGAAAREGRRALLSLPGCRNGDALASALLTAAAPDRMAVYDRRAQFGLERLGYQLTPAPGRYGRYMDLLDDLLVRSGPDADGWTARDVDTALYWLGRQATAAPGDAEEE